MLSLVLLVVLLLIYPIVLLIVGRLTGRRADNDTFFTGNRRTPWYLAWPAMISAAMSGITFVSLPGSVAADGFSYLQMVAGFTVGQLLIAFWLVPRFYRLQVRSIYQYFDHRFGLSAHRSAAWCFVVAKLLSAALKLYMVAAVVQMLFQTGGVELPFWGVAAGVMAIVWGYTRRGGVRTVMQTDLIKSGVMLTALVGIVVALCRALGWSFAEACEVVAQSPFSQVLVLDDPASERYFWKMFVAGIVLLLAMTGLDQDLMQRNLSCRSVGDAQRNIVLTAISQAVVILLFLVLGVLLYAYADAYALARPEDPDQLLPLVAGSEWLPGWVGVLFVLGFSAGSYSAGGSALTALTTSITLDVVGDKQLDENRIARLRVRAHALLAVTLLGLILLLNYLASESVINLIYKVAGYTYGPILGLFLFGEFSRRTIAGRKVWWVVLLSPLLSFGVQYVVGCYLNYRIGFELLLLNAAFTYVGMWLVSRRAPTA